MFGRRMTRDFPTSSTVILNAVPRTPIRAVGVLIATACLLFFAIKPLAYFTVPRVTFSPNLLAEGLLASYTKSSITNLECFSIFTLVLSSNPMRTTPLPVRTSSFISIPRSSLTAIVSLLLRSSAVPVFCSTFPTAANELIGNSNSNRRTAAIRCNIYRTILCTRLCNTCTISGTCHV